MTSRSYSRLFFVQIRFQVGESVRQDIVWYWESRNQFANFNEISAFEEATDRAEKYGGGSNRASRILQSNQVSLADTRCQFQPRFGCRAFETRKDEMNCKGRDPRI